MEKFETLIIIEKGRKLVYNKALLIGAKPLSEKPKSYTKTGYADCITSNNPNYITLYKAKDGSLRYSRYIDGCLKPYYGKVILGEVSDIIEIKPSKY